MAEANQAADRHKKLIEAGWERRFTAEEPRLTEMTESYESLGLEVLVEPGAADEGQECRGCFDLEGFQDRYKTIYTRGRQGAEKNDSEEFFE